MSSAGDVGLQDNAVKVTESEEQLNILKAIANHLESDLEGKDPYHVHYHLYQHLYSEAETRLLKELQKKLND
jgi:hypothetical protein